MFEAIYQYKSALFVRPVGAAMPQLSEVLAYINVDGSARGLTEAEKKYVDTEFSPSDGARALHQVILLDA